MLIIRYLQRPEAYRISTSQVTSVLVRRPTNGYVAAATDGRTPSSMACIRIARTCMILQQYRRRVGNLAKLLLYNHSTANLRSPRANTIGQVCAQSYAAP